MKAYQLKITIRNSHPPIWRRVIVPAGMTFSQLIHIFHIAMGWQGYHLSMFEFKDMGIVIEEHPQDMDWSDYEVLDAEAELIDPLFDEARRFTYVYDFGDDWRHDVTIEDILTDYSFDYPMVDKYKGDIPYEDCGGIDGYYDVLQALEDPGHPDHEEMLEWTEGFGETTYNMDFANSRLKEIQPENPVSSLKWEAAALEEWAKLYEVATEIKSRKPWEHFCDLDIIALINNENDIVFMSILGYGGECFGVCVYEGYEGFNDFMMLVHAEELNVSQEYAMFSQNTLCCYWGDRQDLSKRQWEIVRSLGYRYRGKNQWLYFMSNKKGYYPYNLSRDEVLRMTEYLTGLKEAVDYYEKNNMAVDFREGNLFLYYFDHEKREWLGKEHPFPFFDFNRGQLIMDEPEAGEKLQGVEQLDACWQVDVVYLGVAYGNEKYARPANPRVCIAVDKESGHVCSVHMLEPEDDEPSGMANLLVDLFFQNGKPKKIEVANLIIADYIADLCKIADVKLVQVDRLRRVNQFINRLRHIE